MNPAGSGWWPRVSIALVVLLSVSASSVAWADCASDCQSSYHNCLRGSNADSCLSAQGVCLNRCTVARERHGAIAYSARTHVFGYSYDHGSVKAAGDVAVRQCRDQERGADDCRVVVTFHNACGALALGDGGAYGSAWALSQREASAKALDECRPHGGASCTIRRQVCSGARR
jgi:hypothetical protein